MTTMTAFEQDKLLIKRVQAALIQRGYNLGPGGDDGIIGNMTTNAIRNFQRDIALNVRWPGTIGPKTLAALGIINDPNNVVPDSITPPWVVEGRRRIGLQEGRDNKKLSEYLKSDGRYLGDPAKNPWCGDFQDTIIGRTLSDEPLLSNPYWALNWTKFGVAVPDGIVPLGGIVPFRRPGGGHIGTLVGHDNSYYHVLGGNQSNGITIAKIKKDRLEGRIRWPKTYPLPTTSMPRTTIDATITTNEA